MFGRYALAAAWLAAASPAAHAQDTAPVSSDVLDVAASVNVVSDYRYRGMSLTNERPALQSDLTLTHSSGLYGYAWVSTIAENGGADIESQLQLGYSRQIGTAQIDVGVAYYLYPGARADNYFEAIGRLSHKVGPAELGATISYAPNQQNIGGTDNFYASLDGKLPIGASPVSFTGSFGIEDGAFGDAKRDWSIGLVASKDIWSLGLQYVDANRTGGDPNGKATAVLFASASF